ncbi:FCSD flavin-binding domain-containing protein [Hydrogenophaga sp. MI9]|uniref:FCSD flavin-binding domain-containing protein n=1 Tax=Hydrogenophaga sp. MI9 TaxID=3453719 RepID=UPI003EEE0815
MQRRRLVQGLGAGSVLARVAGAASLAGCAAVGGQPPRVVVVGGGFGGATAAKYLRLFSDHGIEVTLVEPAAAFVSCPVSNLVLQGSRALADITLSYDALARHHGVRIVRDRVSAIDTDRRRVRLAGGAELPYDRLILSPGIDFLWDALPGLSAEGAREKVLHAWKAGPQTVALRRQLEAMPDGGVYALTIPPAPYRCPPGPYERACMVASYFKQAKPRSKVIVFDANDDIVSKKALFLQAWSEHYPGLIEYRPKHRLADVDAATLTLKFDLQDDVRAAVANVLPEMRAGDIAVRSGLATANGRWCEVDFLSFESKAAKHIHVLGDAIQIAPAMPKSGHMANQHGKTCAAAVVALLQGQAPPPQPLYANTCYSFVTATAAMHVSSVHRYDAEKKTMLTVPGAGGLSSAASEAEAQYAHAWARNIWADTLA